jgi:hypothetical protein
MDAAFKPLERDAVQLFDHERDVPNEAARRKLRQFWLP